MERQRQKRGKYPIENILIELINDTKKQRHYIESTFEFQMMQMLADQFRKHDLPIKSVTKINMEEYAKTVIPSLISKPSRCEEFMESLGRSLAQFYETIQDEFGEDADDIFSNLISGVSFARLYCRWNKKQ